MYKLFSADGIRGFVSHPPFTQEGILHLGKSLGAWQREHERSPVFLIGKDTRPSSRRISGILIDSLNQSGIVTVDAGVLPTPALSYLLAKKTFFTGGIVISASHNPINENGIKVFDRFGIKIGDSAEARIEDFYFKRAALPHLIHRARNRTEDTYIIEYVEDMAYEFRHLFFDQFRVLIDCANGAAFSTAPTTFEKLGIEPLLFNAWPDGTNINHLAGSEFTRINPRHMQAELQRYHLPIGVALDGDADRVVFLDHEGQFYDGDMLLAILATQLKRTNLLAQNKVVSTNMGNSGLKEYLDNQDIQLVTVRNGDKYVTDTILDQKLSLGGEQIGHLVIYTHPSRVTGDGLRTALMVLGELDAHPGLYLADLAPGMKKWPQVNASVVLNRRTTKPKEEIPGLTDKIESIHLHYPDVKIRECRPASTEASYRIMAESRFSPTCVLAGLVKELAEVICDQLDFAQRRIHIFDCVNGGEIFPE